MKKRSEALFDKSIAAAISAMELYNKPDFKYREESFIIILVNAWELLLKAKILQENNNKLTSLYIKKAKENKKGQKTKVLIYVPNRSGGKKTISLFEAIAKLNNAGFKLDKKCFENIEAITEIRDNAIHLSNSEKILNKKIQELGTASLKNYLQLIKNWFDGSFSEKLANFNFYLMPMSFFNELGEVDGISLNSKNKDLKNLVKYLAAKEKSNPYSKNSEFQMSVKVDLRFTKSDTEGVINCTLSRDDDAIKIALSDEERNKKYPLAYHEMMQKAKNIEPNLIANKVLHAIVKSLEANKKLCYFRYLDIKAKTSLKKFYNANFPHELVMKYREVK